MKEKILLFIIGLLVGAVISTGAFFIYTKATTCSNTNNQQVGTSGGNPPSMPNGQNSQNGQPPEMTNNNNTQNDSNSQNNSNTQQNNSNTQQNNN